MKFLIFAVAFAVTSSAFARASVLEFSIKKATFAAAHVKNAGGGNLVLNYDKKEVTLTVKRRFSCPEGRMCAQVMPAPMIVQLPVVSVTKDSCGIRTVTAKEDGRPVDGILQEIVVKDPTRMTCKTFKAVAPTAIYKTAFYNRMSGKLVEDQSSMVLAHESSDVGFESEQFETSLAPSILIKLVRLSGFSPEPKTQTLYVDITGRVLNAVKNHRTDKTTQTEVAQLSESALNALNRKVESIDPATKLVDHNDGEPKCMDAPTTSVEVSVKGQSVTIFKFADCHTHEVTDANARPLRDIMRGFDSLVR